MIDKKLEPYYDIILSIFIGVLIVVLIYFVYNQPRIVTFDASPSEHFSNRQPCNNLNLHL